MQMACRIQKIFRGNKGRREFQLRLDAKNAHEQYIFTSATRVQSQYRGRLDRRAAGVQQALKLIREAHPKLMKKALQTPFGQKRVFWYTSKQQLKLLYSYVFIPFNN